MKSFRQWVGNSSRLPFDQCLRNPDPARCVRCILRVQVLAPQGTPTTDLPKTNYLFTGRELEPATGLYNYRNRFYHPGVGRFLQPDPIGFQGGEVNWYRYVGNRAANLRDPLGLQMLVAGQGVGVSGMGIGTGVLPPPVSEGTPPSAGDCSDIEMSEDEGEIDANLTTPNRCILGLVSSRNGAAFTSADNRMVESFSLRAKCL